MIHLKSSPKQENPASESYEIVALRNGEKVHVLDGYCLDCFCVKALGNI